MDEYLILEEKIRKMNAFKKAYPVLDPLNIIQFSARCQTPVPSEVGFLWLYRYAHDVALW